MQAPDLAVGALVDDQQVDDADDVALAQALELGEHLAAEVGPVEGDDEELDGSHRGRLHQSPRTLRFAEPELLRREHPVVEERLQVLELLDDVALRRDLGAAACRRAASCFRRASSSPYWKPTPPSIIGARLSGLSTISRT